VLVPSPTQAVAFRDWVRDSLNRGDDGALEVPEPFPPEAVDWAGSDQPRPERSCVITPISITSLHSRPVLIRAVTALGLPAQALTTTTYDIREWAVSVEVASRLDPANRTLADSAATWIQRVHADFVAASWTSAMRRVGLAVQRRGPVVDVARLVGSTEWETRSNVTLTLWSGYQRSRSEEWVEQVTGVGTVPPAPPLPFDSQGGA
jgi:hypothetical protein